MQSKPTGLANQLRRGKNRWKEHHINVNLVIIFSQDGISKYIFNLIESRKIVLRTSCGRFCYMNIKITLLLTPFNLHYLFFLFVLISWINYGDGIGTMVGYVYMMVRRVINNAIRIDTHWYSCNLFVFGVVYYRYVIWEGISYV